MSLATARKLHWSGAVGKSEADHLALDIEFARTKCAPGEVLDHYLEVNERRLAGMNGEQITETRVVQGHDLGMCGCGRPRSRDHGRCWYRRQLEGKGTANGGGQAVTAVKTKRPYVRKAKATASDRVRNAKEAFEDAYAAPAPVTTYRPSNTLELCLADLRERREKLDEAISAVERVLQMGVIK